MDGFMDQIKGRIKQVAGVLTNNKQLTAEGRNDELLGEVKNKINKVAASLKKQI